MSEIDTTLIVEAYSNSITQSIWFWLSILELIIIIILIYQLYKVKRNLEFYNFSKEKIKEAKRSDVNMDDLMDSINKSKELYKELSRLCHPDRFVNTEKHQIAELIFQEITKNKRNYKELSKLKTRAINELNINF